MQNQELDNPPPYRQAVEMLRQAGSAPLDRQDVELAAEVLFSDPSGLMQLFDAATEIKAASPSAVRLHADFVSVRRMAESLIRLGDMEALAEGSGGALPDGCLKRLKAGRDDPDRRPHHLAAAADHYAHDIMESLAVLTGRNGLSITLHLPESFDIATLTSLPFLRFMTPEGQANA
nr:hypothetical protein [Neorhizobium tomejilense]